MSRVLIAAGALLGLLGLVWIGQGLGYLPGSFMTGRPEWARNGALMLLIGAGMVVLGLRRRSRL